MDRMESVRHLNMLIEKDRIIRRVWKARDDSGVECMCLLSALSPAVLLTHNIEECSEELMPQWMAHLTIWISDSGSYSAWSRAIVRYAKAVERWHVLTASEWDRLKLDICMVLVTEAVAINKTIDVHSWDGVGYNFSGVYQLAVDSLKSNSSEMLTKVYQKTSNDLSSGRVGVEYSSLLVILYLASFVGAHLHNPSITDKTLNYKADVALRGVANSVTAYTSAADRLVDAVLLVIEAACDKAEAKS